MPARAQPACVARTTTRSWRQANIGEVTIRIALLLSVATLLSACGSVDYKDANAAVDARPECVGSDPTHPGDKVPPWCKRETQTTWSSDDKSEPLDLSGKKHKP